MWPFFLTFSILFTHPIHVESWQCYGLLKQCTTGTRAFSDIKLINPGNMYHFCENYTYSIIPCLANRMKQQPGNTPPERFLTFRKCVQNDRLMYNKSNCVEKTPTVRKCYYWHCKSDDFLTIKKSSLDLAREDEENEDDENINKPSKEKQKLSLDLKVGKLRKFPIVRTQTPPRSKKVETIEQ